MITRYYRKRPVVIKAVQLTKDADWEQIAEWCGGRLYNHTIAPGADPETVLTIHTLEGDHYALEGDFIVCGVQGEFYPVKPDIFATTYEPTTEKPA